MSAVLEPHNGRPQQAPLEPHAAGCGLLADPAHAVPPGIRILCEPAPGSALSAQPRLTTARGTLTRETRVMDEYGEFRLLHIPVERPLTVYVDKRELVTLMTLGAAPELLVLGYLRNQSLLQGPGDIESVTVDWDVGAAAVRTRAGVRDIEERTAHRVVTTGCGQGTVFGAQQDQLDAIRLPDATQARIHQRTLRSLLDVMRQQPSVHRKAGSVHGCALFQGDELLMFVEDVGRHNAIDTIAGWMWMAGIDGADKTFYTTGRLTSEMVTKSALMGVPIIVSRNGVTEMGLSLAERLGMTLFGRAANRHFLCYSGFDRFEAEPEPQRTAVRVVAG